MLLQLPPPSLPVLPSLGKVDPYSLFVSTFWVISVIIAALVTWLKTKKSLIGVSQDEAKAWEGLAKARSEELSNVTRRVTDLESRVTDLRRENEDVRSLNVNLQKENQDLRGEVRSLNGRISEMESHMASGKNLEEDVLRLTGVSRRLMVRLNEVETDLNLPITKLKDYEP